MFAAAPTGVRKEATVRDPWFSDFFDWRLTQMNKRFGCLFGAAMAATGLLLGACSKPPEATAPAPATSVRAASAAAAAANVSDIDVSEHVKTALQQNDSLKGFDITVVTLKGDVRLIGVLNTQAQIDEAIKIARASDGAHSIHDELTLKK
jgi:hyperosmotically inducible periplasmic protein